MRTRRNARGVPLLGPAATVGRGDLAPPPRHQPLAVNLDRNQLSSSDRRVFHGANSIARTAKEALVHP